MAKLTAKQQRFVDEYLIDLNATQAAIRAGYSIKTASRIALELLNKTHVSDRIQERMTERSHRTEITQDQVLRELANIGFYDANDYARVVEGTGVELTNTDTLSPDQRAAIAGIKQGPNGIEVKLHDKLKALELIGRHIGMFTDKVDVSGVQVVIHNDLTN